MTDAFKCFQALILKILSKLTIIFTALQRGPQRGTPTSSPACLRVEIPRST